MEKAVYAMILVVVMMFGLFFTGCTVKILTFGQDETDKKYFIGADYGKEK